MCETGPPLETCRLAPRARTTIPPSSGRAGRAHREGVPAGGYRMIPRISATRPLGIFGAGSCTTRDLSSMEPCWHTEVGGCTGTSVDVLPAIPTRSSIAEGWQGPPLWCESPGPGMSIATSAGADAVVPGRSATGDAEASGRHGET